MSLILDALKKSEAERQRGMPPTLHAHFSAPRRARRAPWVAGAGAVLLVAGLAGSWMWLARGRVDAGLDSPEGQVASAGAAMDGGDARVANAQTEPMVAPDLASTDMPVDTAVAMVPVAAAGTAAAESAFGGVAGDGAGGTVSGGGLPVPQRAMLYTPTVTPTADTASADPAPVAAPPVPVEVPPVVAAPEMPTQAAAPPPPPMAEPAMPISVDAPATAAVDSGPSKPEEVLPNVFQLPYATRKDLPKLELSMHVFSPDASERFIVLNGKRYTLETPAPGPELSLLDIVADGAVLEFRGQRFLLPRQTY